MSIHGLVALRMIHKNKEAVFRILPRFANCAATDARTKLPTDTAMSIPGWASSLPPALTCPRVIYAGFVERPVTRNGGTRAVRGRRRCQPSTDGGATGNPEELTTGSGRSHPPSFGEPGCSVTRHCRTPPRAPAPWNSRPATLPGPVPFPAPVPQREPLAHRARRE